MGKKILVINTGSTSTKVAFFEDETMLINEELKVPEEEIRGKLKAVEQIDFRVETVRDFMERNGIKLENLDIISCRGGSVPPCKSGAYYVNQAMVDVLTYAPVTQHESSLSCMIGLKIAGERIPVIIYDSINTDEFDDISRITGVPEIQNFSRGHVLNTRSVGRRLCEKRGIDYCKSNVIVAHFGGSISISAHRNGKIVDMVTPFNGPMSPQRAGRLFTIELIAMCYSGKYTQQELYKKLNGKSGFAAYFGTQDARTVFEMVENGDEKARLIVSAMAYQCAKGIAEMAAVFSGKVDFIAYTGGMARSKLFTDMISERIGFIAPIEIMPGEFEMQALASGALRVLNGQEEAAVFDLLPKGYASMEEFYRNFAIK